MRPLVSTGHKHSATVRMRGAARCLSKCGLSFKGLVIAARLCGAALCFCLRDSTLSSFPLLLSLLPLQAYALTFHTPVTGVDTSALKHPASLGNVNVRISFWRTDAVFAAACMYIRIPIRGTARRFDGRMPRPAQPVLALQSVSVWALTVPLTRALQPTRGLDLLCIVLLCTRAPCIRSSRISFCIYAPSAHAKLRLSCP